MQPALPSVLYVYQCATCRHRGEVRHDDDSHDGQITSCDQCGSPVTLEWDGGVVLVPQRPGAPRSPTGAELRDYRLSTRRTQEQMARLLGVTTRQYQRWEAGSHDMPGPHWDWLQRAWGKRYPADFAVAPVTTRGWDTQRDMRRNTIERGDVVELQPLDGPRLRATVCLDRAHDGLADEASYGAFVIEFVGAADAGQEYQGFFIGERVTFAVQNVFHLEQRAPAATIGHTSNKEAS
ncbi:helix-turn-helix domain-containing protein [Burkholderia gladioli]|uniref:helix-turn-helix domain-containing protein n=1 Tax=Burkholderia gladioli TaxID=28095 RepID=UPI0016407A24|nr:helix-turn-helix transcriptional regulator [Burkholderia gladioli]